MIDLVLWGLWFLIGLVVYSLTVGVVMEFSVDRSNPRLKGEKLKIKADGFVVKDIYRNNWFRGYNETPSNICALYRGLWWGLISAAFSGVFFLLTGVILAVAGFACGFLLNLRNDSDLFHKFERFGENDEKKWIAPWKILIPILVLVFHKHILSFLEFISRPLLTKTALYIYFAVITMAAVVFIITKAIKVAEKKEFWQATKEYVKSVKGKVCLEIEPVERT